MALFKLDDISIFSGDLVFQLTLNDGVSACGVI